jgi:hypothetical protein
VKTTVVPEQILVPWLEVIVIDGGITAFTVIAMALLVLVDGFGHAALLVIKHVTTSPFCSVVVVNELLEVPVGLPLICH